MARTAFQPSFRAIWGTPHLGLVTLVPRPSGPFSQDYIWETLELVEMKSPGTTQQRRQEQRTKAVLPVRISGKDASGNPFDELAHTLDIAPQGGRLASIHRELKPLDRLTVQYRQHRMEFRVVWTKLIENAREYQIGLQATEEKAAWGLRSESKSADPALSPSEKSMSAHGAA